MISAARTGFRRLAVILTFVAVINNLYVVQAAADAVVSSESKFSLRGSSAAIHGQAARQDRSMINMRSGHDLEDLADELPDVIAPAFKSGQLAQSVQAFSAAAAGASQLNSMLNNNQATTTNLPSSITDSLGTLSETLSGPSAHDSSAAAHDTSLSSNAADALNDFSASAISSSIQNLEASVAQQQWLNPVRRFLSQQTASAPAKTATTTKTQESGSASTAAGSTHVMNMAVYDDSMDAAADLDW